MNITSGLTLDNLDSLETITFPSLLQVGSGVHVYTMISLESMTFSNVTSVGSIILYNSRVLRTLLMPQLVNVTGSITLSHMYQMTGTALSAAWPNLQMIGDLFYMLYVPWSGNVDARTPLTLPQLTSVGSWYFQNSYVWP